MFMNESYSNKVRKYNLIYDILLYPIMVSLGEN